MAWEMQKEREENRRMVLQGSTCNMYFIGYNVFIWLLFAM